MKEVDIYTDGACSGNPGPGGWGAVLICKENRKEISGKEAYTTNNRMELSALVEALKLLKEPCLVRVYSDSAYLINAFARHWIDKWQRNGWRNNKNDEVENRDLWEEIISLSADHKMEWHKVKGHHGVFLNERCDKLASEEVKKEKNDLGTCRS
jgi:ribonuclease HI